MNEFWPLPSATLDLFCVWGSLQKVVSGFFRPHGLSTIRGNYTCVGTFFFLTDFAIIHLWCSLSDWPGRNVVYSKWVVFPHRYRKCSNVRLIGETKPICFTYFYPRSVCLDFYSVIKLINPLSWQKDSFHPSLEDYLYLFANGVCLLLFTAPSALMLHFLCTVFATPASCFLLHWLKNDSNEWKDAWWLKQT